MPGVLDLADILQLVVAGLDEGSFAEEGLVPEAHEAIVHVLADFGQECEALGPEHSVQRLRDIAPVSKELAKEPFG
jgi:hypothetical protein